MAVELDGQIALIRGWTELRPTHFSEVHDLMGKAPNGRIMLVPRWSSDLNAMWELEEGMDEKDYIDYCVELLAILQPGRTTVSSLESVAHATAEQKARSFLAAMEGKS